MVRTGASERDIERVKGRNEAAGEAARIVSGTIAQRGRTIEVNQRGTIEIEIHYGRE